MKWYQRIVKKLAQWTNTPLELPPLENPYANPTPVRVDRKVCEVRAEVRMPDWLSGDMVEQQLRKEISAEVMQYVTIEEFGSSGDGVQRYRASLWVVEGGE